MKQISRRDFLKGSLSGAAGLALASMLPHAYAENAESEKAGNPFFFEPESVAAEYSYDVVIVGGGISGLAAAVQAGESGLNAILIEAGASVGGNGNGVEGIFGCNTSAQKELGIPELDAGQIIRHELSSSQYFPNGVLWTDLVNASVENYEWLKEQGVGFSGRVDAYGGLYDTMHWFEGDMAAVGYVPPMKEKAESYGVQIMVKTPGKSLIVKDGAVVGIYAQQEDGSYIRINANAVVLATGGFGYNNEMLKRWGFNLDHLTKLGNPLNNGDGINMALAVGAQDCIDDACFLAAPDIDGIFGKGDAGGKLGFGGPFLWVNPDGDRFVNEDLVTENLMITYMPAIEQRNFYCVVDSVVLNAVLDGPRSVTAATERDAFEEFFSAVEECPSDNIYQADTVEELAGKFNMKPEVLVNAVDRYNAMCDQGHDTDFGKDPSMLLPLREAPFYMFRMDPGVMVAIGGLGTNRDMQVVNDDGAAIPGLYAIGTDGVRLYRRVYPINIGATCCANNVNSGRRAIRHIAANL